MFDYQGEKFRVFISNVKNNYRKYGFESRPTNEELANLLGVSSVQMNRYYKSQSLERDTVQRIISVFGVSEGEIWGSGRSEDENVVNHLRAELEAVKKLVEGYQNAIMDLQHQSIADKTEIIRLTNRLYNKSKVPEAIDVCQ